MQLTVKEFIETFVVDGITIRLFDFGTCEDVRECDTFDDYAEWEDRIVASVEVDGNVLIINMEEE